MEVCRCQNSSCWFPCGLSNRFLSRVLCFHWQLCLHPLGLAFEDMQVLRSREMLSFKHSGQALRYKNQSLRQENKEEVHKQSNERLGLLHSRLQQEAEKIRQWKNSTELEIQQKNHQIQTAQQLIDKQQKSLIDVQLKNESLSSRIEEEVANQKEIQRKINSTREMCNALKEHVFKVEQAVELGESDRKKLMEEDAQTQQQYMELLEQFKSLENEQSEKYDSLTKNIEAKEAENKVLLVQLSELKVTSRKEISALQSELEALNTNLNEAKSTVVLQTEKITSLELENNELEQRVNDGESALKVKEGDLKIKDQELESRKVELMTLTANIEALNNDISQLKLTCSEAQRHIDDLTSSHLKRENELIDCCDRLKTEIEKEKQKLAELESQLKNTENEKTSLEKQCTGLNEILVAAQNEKANLGSQLSCLNDSHKELTEDLTRLETELSACQQQISALLLELKEKESEREVLKTKMDSLLEEKDKQVEEMIRKLVEIESIVEKMEEEKKDLLLILKEKEGSIRDLELKNKSLESTMTMNAKETKLELTQIRDNVIQKERVKEQLIKEKEDLRNELEKLCQTIKESESITLELKKDIAAKTKSIQSYEQEMEQAKSEKCQQDKENQLLLREKEALEKKIEEMDKEVSSCKKMEAEAKMKMNSLAEETGVTLERYNAENARILEQKAKEILSLQEAKVLETKGKEEMKRKVAKLEKEVQRLNQERKECAAEDSEQYQMEIDSLKLQLKEKEEEIKELIMAAKVLQQQLDNASKIKQKESTTAAVGKTITPKAGPPLKGPSKRPFSSIENTLSTHTSSQSQTKKSNKETQEKRNFRQLYPDLENETPSFKKPRTKPSYSLTPNTSGGFRGRKSSKGRGVRQTEKNTSWFDTDPVFGFPSDN